ncbi:hypothetical protein CPC08DRAFT_771451 [Agrocybe pediades]|nr:hypothetical protein CPC08DRAFT_771451 [Agrocybe pediades]
MSMLPSPGLSQLLDGLKNIQSARYSHVAGCSIIVYDQLITFGQEVNLIWLEDFSVGKVLFLTIRYYALSLVVLDLYAFFPKAITNELRIYALYPNNRIVLGMMVLVFLASTGISASIIIKGVWDLNCYVLTLPSGSEYCVPSRFVKNYYTYYIPILVLESILCGLAVYKTIIMRNTSTLSVFASGRHFLYLLFRDSVVYFIALLATHVTTMLLWLLASFQVDEIPSIFAVAFTVVFINRLILNIRSMKYKSGYGSTGSTPFRNVNYLSQPGAEGQVIRVTRTVDAERESGTD